jgi:hypothetical protein
MGIFRWFKKRTSDKGSLLPGKRLPIEQILLMDNPTDMIIELSYGISDKVNRSGFDSLSYAEKCMHHVYWLETEVNNGGFDQYFFNSSGDYAIDTPAMLEEIGAHHTAQIVKEAISIFPGGAPSRDREERLKMYELISDEISRRLNELDSKFYEYKDPLEDLQVSYMKMKQDEINI